MNKESDFEGTKMFTRIHFESVYIYLGQCYIRMRDNASGNAMVCDLLTTSQICKILLRLHNLTVSYFYTIISFVILSDCFFLFTHLHPPCLLKVKVRPKNNYFSNSNYLYISILGPHLYKKEKPVISNLRTKQKVYKLHKYITFSLNWQH